MKNQKVVIGVVVAIVLLLLGGWIVIKSSKSSVRMEVSDKDNAPAEVKTENAKMSISDIMGQGGNVKCTYQVNSSDSGSMNATVYISGKKMRVETANVDSTGKSVDSQMVSDGNYVYVWSDKETTGVKMAAGNAEASGSAWQGQAQYVDPTQKMDYVCDSWNVDEGVFNLPSTVQFTDMTQLQKSQCATCDYLSGEQKTSCRKTLGCE